MGNSNCLRTIKTVEIDDNKIIINNKKRRMSCPTVLNNPRAKEKVNNISILNNQEQFTDKEIFKKVKEIGNKNNNCQSYLIRSTETKDEYAYKIINVSGSNDEFVKKALNDFEILKTLNHPNIITFVDGYFSNDKKYLYVFTEYADNGDLQMQLDKHKEKGENFDEDTLLNWLMQICFALKYIHKKKILHRDIKPSNIFLIKDNFAKLGDFGVAKTLNNTLKHTKTLVAKPQYLAPEIFKKKDILIKLIFGL